MAALLVPTAEETADDEDDVFPQLQLAADESPLAHQGLAFSPRVPHGPPHPARDATSRRATASGCLILVGVLVCSALVLSGGRWETAIAQETILAVIGDYRVPGEPEADVANLVRSWNPDVVITTGDNCYDPGDYLSNVDPYYGDFVAAGQFLPAIGNHDRDDCGGLEACATYFNVPRYYEVASGAVHIFILNSEPDEPDGVTSDSPQAEWVRNALAASTAPWKMVVAHRPPIHQGLSTALRAICNGRLRTGEPPWSSREMTIGTNGCSWMISRTLSSASVGPLFTPLARRLRGA